jgi:DNA-binding MarR family transcriptional regulator
VSLPASAELTSAAVRAAAHLEAIGRVLSRTRWAEARRLPIPLTPPQMLAMQVLVESARNEPGVRALSLSELSERMGLAHSTVSGIVARLERHGLVDRTVRSEDRRYVRIHLTDKVRHWLAHDLPALGIEPLTAALTQATPAEREAIMTGLSALARLLEPAASAGV